MRREQGVEAIIGELSLQRFEANLLQNHVAVRIGEDLLVNPVAATAIGVGQFKGGDAGLEGLVLEGAMPFFLGEEVPSVGDDEAEVASASLIDPREVNLIQNAVAGGEPDLAVLV